MAKKKVTRKFLLDLANKIYNRDTRRFLRLCPGTLQNGPDPTDESRPMHCGLGELYFAMTGRQPKSDHVREDDVIDTAVELSTFTKEAEKARRQAIKVVKALRLPSAVEERFIEDVKNLDDGELTPELEFRAILNQIPSTNDNSCFSTSCSTSDYNVFRSRSAQVAKKLREAAALLPE